MIVEEGLVDYLVSSIIELPGSKDLSGDESPITLREFPYTSVLLGLGSSK